MSLIETFMIAWHFFFLIFFFFSNVPDLSNVLGEYSIIITDINHGKTELFTVQQWQCMNK